MHSSLGRFWDQIKIAFPNDKDLVFIQLSNFWNCLSIGKIERQDAHV